MFRREEGPEGPERYAAIGLWGSGNVIGDRGVLRPGESSGWSMWDGHALFGPARPGTIEKFPALIAVLDVDTFLDRYSVLGERCEMWTGEVVGQGCEAACAHVRDVCPSRDPRACLRDCERAPRMVVDCLDSARGCQDVDRCDGARDELPGDRAGR